MRSPTRAWRAAAVFAAAVLTLAGCGGDGAGPGGGGNQNNAGGGGGGNGNGGGGGGDGQASAAECNQEIPRKQSDGTLTFGSILPQTGSLAFLGPPEFAGLELAVNEINAAGGVLGKDVEYFPGDSGDDTTNIAAQTYQRLKSKDVDAMIGAASSAVSLLVIDEITGDGVMQVSPANTSQVLSTYNDNCLYFRTAPPDELQGTVLADLIAADGNETLGIMALQDAYGTGLANVTDRVFSEGGGNVVEKIVFDPKSPNFATEVSKLKAQDPQALAMITFDEIIKIMPELVKQGIGPEDKNIYFVDGNLADYSKQFPQGTLDGVKGTLPGAQASEQLRNRLLKVNPDLTEYAYAPEAYDATVLVALAATAADSDVPADYADDMIEVSEQGTKCTGFKECAPLLEQGEDIDYDGYSGPVEFLPNGDPGQAVIGIYQYGPDNNYTFLTEREGQIN